AGVAGHAVDQLSRLEQQQRGNRADLVAHRRLLILVDVQLDDADLPGELVGQRLEMWGNGSTGTAPDRPEVDEDGDIRFEDVGLEAGVTDVRDGLRRHASIPGEGLCGDTAKRLP